MGLQLSFDSQGGDKFILQQAVCKDAERQNPEQVKRVGKYTGRISEDAGVADNEWKTVYLLSKSP